jgi:hypothetical protein
MSRFQSQHNKAKISIFKMTLWRDICHLSSINKVKKQIYAKALRKTFLVYHQCENILTSVTDYTCASGRKL